MNTLGIFGGGQLARMLALAAAPLGVRCRVYEPGAEPCAAPYADIVRADWDDRAALASFASGLSAATFDFENVPTASAEAVAHTVPIRPSPAALAVAQDRLGEKQCFNGLGLATPHFIAVDDLAGLKRAVEALALPAVLKTRRLGYDGKGQFVLRAGADIERAWQTLGGVPLILEAFVPFARELSVIAVRGLDGDFRPWALTQNWHRDGVLALSLAPAPDPRGLARRASAIAERLALHLNYVGVLTVELFEHDDQLLVNEMAPRVHNSGHWTIEGAQTSQFANHVRAVLGLALGTTESRGPAAMINFVGAMPSRDAALRVPGLNWHDYGKTPKPGRKLGHATLIADDAAELHRRLQLLQGALDSSVDVAPLLGALAQ